VLRSETSASPSRGTPAGRRARRRGCATATPPDSAGERPGQRLRAGNRKVPGKRFSDQPAASRIVSVAKLAAVEECLCRRMSVHQRYRADQRLRARQPGLVQLCLNVVDGLQSLAGLARLMGFDHNPAIIAESNGDDRTDARRAKQHLGDSRPELHRAKAIHHRRDLTRIPRPEHHLLNHSAALEPGTGIAASSHWFEHKPIINSARVRCDRMATQCHHADQRLRSRSRRS
jgi:hypothetical protein